MKVLFQGKTPMQKVIRAGLPLSLSALLAVSVISTVSSASLHQSKSHYDAASNAWCQPIKVFGPSSLNPLTATDAQLVAAGFPSRPPGNDSGALAAWTNAMSRAK